MNSVEREVAGEVVTQATVVVGEAQDQHEAAEHETTLSGRGVEKTQGFLNTEGQYLSGDSEVGVEKPTAELNKSGPNGLIEVCSNGPRDEDFRRLFPALAPLGKPGRPRVLTMEVCEKICVLLSVGLSRRQAASYVGIDQSTISLAASKYPEFAAELRRAEDVCDSQPEITLMAAVLKDWRAAAWLKSFRAKNPRPLSAEEIEERHQAKLAEDRRSEERTRQSMLATDESFAALAEARFFRPSPGSTPAKPVRKRKGK